MPEKENKVVDKRVENIIKGLFLVLFTLMVMINAGKVGRTFAFLPFYLFGAASYLIFGFAIFVGLYRVIKKESFKFKWKSIPVGLILALFSLVFIFSYINFKSNGKSFNGISFAELVNQYNGQLSSFYSLKFINLFDFNSLWPMGLFGSLFSGMIANDAIILFIGIILFLLAVFCFTYHFFLFKKDKKSRKERKAEKEAAKKSFIEESEKEDDNPVISHKSPFGYGAQEEAKEALEPAEVKPGYEKEDNFINENSGFNQISPSLDRVYSGENNIKQGEYTEFTPLVFNNDSSPFGRFIENNQAPNRIAPIAKPQENIENNQTATEIQEQIYEGPEFVEEEEEINYIDSRPVEPVIEERKVDESLVKAQPQFSEIKEVHTSDTSTYSQPVIENKPAEEVKKKRERVVWIPPSSDLLMTYETDQARELNESVANERVVVLNSILSDFRIGASISGYTIGPSITRFNIEYEPNVSSKTIEKYVQDISRRLGGIGARFAPVVQGESYSGLEVPNATITTVSFKDVFLALPDVKKHPLAVAFGKNISGDVIYADFNDFPHLLVAGTTGSGKSIFVHSIISTLIMRNSPDDLKIVLVDPKKVEMTKYRDMPHLLCPIITEAEKAKVCLQKLVAEMERRYAILADDPEISGIKDYNEKAREKGEETMPYIIAVLDEYADLVDQCKEISQPVVSIAQKARSAGIFLLLATQRPSTNVITGVIKGNLPTRVALATSSYTDSMTIIGEGGAETLLGKGDMLVQSALISRYGVTRLQGCYVQNKEIVHVVNYLKEHYETHYDEEFLDLVDHSKEPATPVAPGEVEKESSAEEEAKYQSIKEWVMSQQFVSMSKIQRECSVGFNRAGRFFSRLQKEGIVATTQDGSSKGCRVLVHDKYYDGDLDIGSDELIG